MKSWLLMLLALSLALPARAGAQDYDFSFVDPFLATIVGTPPTARADLPERVALQDRELVVFPDREIPDAFWYIDRLRFGFLAQDKKAPLAFVIAGTGAGHAG